MKEIAFTIFTWIWQVLIPYFKIAFVSFLILINLYSTATFRHYTGYIQMDNTVKKAEKYVFVRVFGKLLSGF